MTLRAQKPYGQQMTDWQQAVDDLSGAGYSGTSMVFGDSRAKGPSDYDWKSIDVSPATLAVGGLTAEQILWTIKQTNLGWTANVKEVFLSAGNNNFKSALDSSQYIAEATWACVKAIHKIIPGAQIYYFEIFEGAASGVELGQKHDEVNQIMKSDHTQRYYHYVELPPLDPYDPVIYKPDHFHLTDYGNLTELMPAIQQVRAAGAHAPASAVETIQLAASEISGVGGSGANSIYGNDLDNRLAGRGGGDVLVGGSGHDRLSGGSGADLLFGGAGHDVMTGGRGADMFRFTSLAEGGDVIRDYHAAEHDGIDISLLDADAVKAGDQRFHLVDCFSGHAGEASLRYDAVHDRTVLHLDADGDGRSDFTLRISGHAEADAFIL